MGVRKAAALLLGGEFVQDVWRRLGGRDGKLRILAYHRVIDTPESAYPFDYGTVSASTETFRQQMQFVRGNFDVLTFRDLGQCDRDGRSWPRRPLIVTFDDGYHDNYAQAFPILRELNLPATIFLATGHISSDHLFWWDRVGYCVKHSRRDRLELPGFFRAPLPLRQEQDRLRALSQVLEYLKTIPESRKALCCEALESELGVEIPENLGAGMHLSWDEVRTMARQGIEFGSHTVTHPVLANVDDERLDAEIRDSKAMLEQQLGSEAVAFSYPVGRGAFVPPIVRRRVAGWGFRYAVCYDEGVVGRGDIDPWALPRIHVDADHSLRSFRSDLAFAPWILGGALP